MGAPGQESRPPGAGRGRRGKTLRGLQGARPCPPRACSTSVVLRHQFVAVCYGRPRTRTPRGSSGRLWETLVETGSSCCSVQDLSLDTAPQREEPRQCAARSLLSGGTGPRGSVRASSPSVDLEVPDPAVTPSPLSPVKGRRHFWVGAQALLGGGSTGSEVGAPRERLGAPYYQ